MENVQAYVVVSVGLLVPAAYLLFVIFLTRRGREFSRMDDVFNGIARLHKELHVAFLANRRNSPD